MVLNAAPYRNDTGRENQGEDHIRGKIHAKSMKAVGHHLLSKESVSRFLITSQSIRNQTWELSHPWTRSSNTLPSAAVMQIR